MESSECTLATASCTTGWTDWIHGELWICPDGLFRRSLGLRATMAHGSGPTVDPIGRPRRRFSPTEIAQWTSRRRNHWVPWDSIARAELRHGFMTDSLHLELNDGRRRKFLWLAADQAHHVLAPALESSISARLVQARSEAEAPETGRAKSAEDNWPVSLVAKWTDPGVDLLEFRSAVALLAAGVWATGAQLVIDGQVDVRLLALGIFAAGVVGWRARRNRRVALELVLAPHSARLREIRGAEVRSHELPRHRAAWLTASESGLDWRDGGLALFDDAGRQIADFKARLATVTARSDSADGDAWLQSHLPQVDYREVDRVSVTALVGAWWPHPQRRLSVRGSAAVRHRWKEPDLRGFAAWDRKQRRLYAAVFGAFMLFLLVMGILLLMPLGEAIAYFPLVVGGLVFALRHVIW